MADPLDLATDREMATRDAALAAQQERARNAPRLAPTGECHNPHCAEPFAANEPDRLFCGPGCAQDYQRLMRAA